MSNGTTSLYRRPVAVDLFAGAGGFSLGIEQAGFDVLVAVEQDPIHAAVYAFNFPLTQVLCADVGILSPEAIQDAAARGWAKHQQQGLVNPWRGEIDLVFGGPPCQGFSVMGKRCLKDDRNHLVFRFCYLVKALQPRYFVMENVPGLGQGKHAIILKRLQRQFKQAGYRLTQKVQVLNAADFGVPQNRKRLFLLGTRKDEPLLEYPDPEFNWMHKPITVRDAIADLPNLDDFPELKQTDTVCLTTAQRYFYEAFASDYARKLRGSVSDSQNRAYPRETNPQLLTSSMQTQHSAIAIERFSQTQMGQLDTISRLRRLDWDKCCHTLRAGTGAERGSYTSPRPIHPQYPRVISVREAARLHSFPDWFRFHVTKWHGFRQVGNAVPPLLAQALGQQIVRTLEIMPSRPKQPIQLGDTQLLRFKALEAAKYWG
jgi:DNA (cytosine-5)-methyltransferase 1